MGVEELDCGNAARSGNGCSSYVAKGVVKVLPLLVNGLGGPGRDPEPPRLCNFAWFPVVDFTPTLPESGESGEEVAEYEGIFCLDPARRNVSGDTGDKLFASSLVDGVEPERRFRVVNVNFGV